MNGAPRSGKDQFASYLISAFNAHNITAMETKLIAPVRQALAPIVRAYGYDLFNEDSYTRFKDEIIPVFNVTGRQIMIDMAEIFFKSKYGVDFFAKATCHRIETFSPWAQPQVMVYSDIGFQCEVDTLAEAFGEENLILVNITREGTDYTNDSRGDVTFNGITCLVENNESLVDLDTEAVRIVGRMFNQYNMLT